MQEILIPVKKTVFLSRNMNIKEAFQEFKRHKYSRLPVYDAQEEEFVGLVNYMDFLERDTESGEQITAIMHPVMYVDDNVYLKELVVRLLKEKIHLVVVKNSIGMTVGIVTLEDVMEEIVGEY